MPPFAYFQNAAAAAASSRPGVTKFPEQPVLAMASKKNTPPIVIRSSNTHGRGAFATRQIRKGTRIIEYLGTRTSWDEASERPGSDPGDPNYTLIFGLSDGSVIDGSVGGNDARWINHSCEPNCEAIEYDDLRVFIHARRTIHAGEELTYDYHLTLDETISEDTRKGFGCFCGTRVCRGTMLLESPAE